MERGEKRSFDQIQESSVVVYTENEINNLQKSGKERPKFNVIDKFDLNTKIAALKASPFVVSLVSFTGEEVVSQGCGAIIETEGNCYTVVTSLNLVRNPSDPEAEYGENTLAENLKIVINAYDDKSYLGEVFCYDFYFNLLIIKFRSDNSFPSANFMMIDDDSCIEKGASLRRHSLKAKSGDTVIVVGRYFSEPYNFMASSGLLSLQRFYPEEYDCNELLTITCCFNRVFKRYCAESAGLRVNDVIFKCDGELVKGFFELWDLMWNKVGKVVEFEVARLEVKTVVHIRMLVGEASPDERNDWPKYDYR